MVQEFHVVRCFGCESFQVQQVKKVKKWTCKLCGQKQSLLKEFGRGSGPDCRRHVQKLNAARGAIVDEQERRTWSLWEQEHQEEEQEEEEEQVDEQVGQVCCFYSGTQKNSFTWGLLDKTQVEQVSRWSKYLNRHEEAEPEEQNSPEGKTGLTDRLHPHGNIKNTRKRHRSEESTDQRDDAYRLPAQPQPAAAGPSASRWDCFLRADGQEQEPSDCGRSQSGAAQKLRPQLPVRSMFESGEDFSFDDFL